MASERRIDIMHREPIGIRLPRTIVARSRLTSIPDLLIEPDLKYSPGCRDPSHISEDEWWTQMQVDEQLIATVRGALYAAVLSDVLDGLGYRHQVLPPWVRPLDDSVVLCGRARTGLYRDVYHVPPGHNPYELEIALIDDLKPGEVPVLGCGNSGRIAPWGELLTTASIARGAHGCITDGLVRDVRAIRELRFPVFHGGIGPLDSKGRGEVCAIDVPIECAGVTVNPGDLVFGDADGVVVVPQPVVTQTVAKALEKVEGEDRTRDELKQGARLADVFNKYGVL